MVTISKRITKYHAVLSVTIALTEELWPQGCEILVPT